MKSDNGNGAQRKLTRDRICETALGLIDEWGLEGLSMRALASALGVKASSLYYYFASKEDLLAGIADFLFRRLGRLPDGDNWKERVIGTFLQFRDFVHAHPNAAPLLLRDLPHSPVAKRRADALFRIVSRGGLDPITCSCLLSNLVALLVGHTLLASWVKKETAAADALDDHEDPAGDATGWMHEMVHVEGLDEAYPGTPAAPGPAGLVPGYLAGDVSYLAGLTALITGFASDTLPVETPADHGQSRRSTPAGPPSS